MRRKRKYCIFILSPLIWNSSKFDLDLNLRISSTMKHIENRSVSKNTAAALIDIVSVTARANPGWVGLTPLLARTLWRQMQAKSLAAVPELWWTSAVVAAADPPHFKAAVPCFRCPARVGSPLTMTLISRASPHLVLSRHPLL